MTDTEGLSELPLGAESVTGSGAIGGAAGEEADDGVEPVELLVQLAEDGEIDPWDIDIVAVTEAFLDRLERGDLRSSGRALFYASVLLRMKSEAIADRDESPEAEPEPDDRPPCEGGMDGPGGLDVDDGHAGDPIDALEAEMDRRLDRKSARGTPETLDELVRELREAERGSWWKGSRTYDTTDSASGFQRGTQSVDYRADDGSRRAGEPTESEVTGTTHGEDVEEMVGSIQAALERQHAEDRDAVLFREISETAGSPTQTFLGLLFLAHRGHVALEQDDLFEDLYITRPGGGTAAAED
ncbi:MAG: segregation/condensation protein A [Halobacteriaceae archaeon]